MQLTTNGRYVAAGIETPVAGLQSRFLVSAHRFAVVGIQAGPGVPPLIWRAYSQAHHQPHSFWSRYSSASLSKFS
ncbi:DUF1983 domain-containing protein [Pseudomonas sp. RIT-PI-S]|uniref:DUF1983 domain-containing protein n=1 Tax=Pseudomonas sp. RIT-PI-S TaxID=3035295 RepID=UPI0021D8824D|nr:DUF1983 domain-containing protein [Pseudomonas sp. RIT-PI-S]